MRGYALLSIVGFTCSVMSACIASTEPPDGARSGGRIDGTGNSAQALDGICDDPTSNCDPDGDPDTDQDPPKQRCPVKWFCSGTSDAYNSFTACNAVPECSGTCGQDFVCDGTCYCP
jgi:hypothetical protein